MPRTQDLERLEKTTHIRTTERIDEVAQVQDVRTRDETVAAIEWLPTCRQIEVREKRRRMLRTRARWVYAISPEASMAHPVAKEGPPGREVIVDPEKVQAAFAPRNEDLDELDLTFREGITDDYIPRAVLDGPRGRGGLRSDPTGPVPRAERKHWQRKYALAFVLNGRAHFDVNDAFRVGWAPDHVYDLRLAARLHLAALDAEQGDGGGDQEDGSTLERTDEQDRRGVAEPVGGAARASRRGAKGGHGEDSGPGSEVVGA